MLLDNDDTIAAVASPHGKAARGILRVSGPHTVTLCQELFSPDHAAVPLDTNTARRYTGSWPIGNNPQSGSSPPANPPVDLPVDLHLWPNTASYTGQPSAEIHTVGSEPVLQQLLAELLDHKTTLVRAARRGEFTLRAFLAGRIDLVQAEAVLGVIEAEDSTGLTIALRQLAGGLSEPLTQLRQQLVLLLADLEAGLDFADEDIQFVSRPQRQQRLEQLIQSLTTIRHQSRTRMTSPSQNQVVIAGLPNAGKSTLLNSLTQNESAITSPRAGTTRDVITANVTLDGLDVQLLDTAGWEPTAAHTAAHTAAQPTASINQLARQQRLEQLQHAQLVLWCLSTPTADTHTSTHMLNDQQARLEVQAQGTPMLVLFCRSDLATADHNELLSDAELAVSSTTGDGMSQLRDALVNRLSVDPTGPSSVVGSTAARTSQALERTESRLVAAAEVEDELLVAVEIREALDQLGSVMGTVYTEDILDQVFSKFCIGK